MHRFFALLLLSLTFVCCIGLPAPAKAADAASAYATAKKELESLKRDAGRGALREPWERVVSRFDGMVREHPRWPNVPAAMFHGALAKKELASRSFRTADFEDAARRFERVAAKYGWHVLADDALLHAADIRGNRLGDVAASRKLLDSILTRYPSGDMAEPARELLAALSGAPGGDAPKAPVAVGRSGRLEQDDDVPASATGDSARSAGGGVAVASASDGVPAPKTPAKAKKGARSDPAKAAKLYAEARKELEAVRGDARRAALREPWLRVMALYDGARDAAPEGDLAPNAAYGMAVAQEELAARSWRKDDFLAAVARYNDAAAAYPDDSLADDCLLRAARLRATRLDDAEGAHQLLEAQLRRYPKGDMAGEARALLADLTAARTTVSAQPGKAAAPAVSASPASSSPASPAPARGGKPAVLRQVSWRADNDRATITIELSRETEWRSQYAAPDNGAGRPPRLYIDFSDALPDDAVKPGAKVSGALLTRVRSDQPSSGHTRVILDFKALRRYKVQAVRNPYRVVIEVGATDAALPDGQRPDDSRVSVPVREADKATPSAPPKDLVEQLGLTVHTVLIDAGHGGKDPGAMGNGIVERNLTLKMARMVGDRLRRMGFSVIYTRDRDVFVPLDKRTAYANDKKADLFLSLHVNANNDPRICGFETYYLDLARTDSATRVAARENAVSEKSLSDLQFILTDLMLNAKTQESRDVANFVQDSALGRLRRGGFPAHDNGVRSAPFYVLMGARMPSVLVELGYCTNPDEARRLNSEQYLSTLADGIAEGVATYKRKLARFSQ
ncbi:N-acetylmuramoyl-L-alanine amidase [Nitratidesulfovibrio sp. SRB-5]|uniref:N-acetylmuramoyl-L-alanine amidase n=1 Tax=Nitratidesulfovibrio sp. SRB-5 TaxID=2872636 RepID=UPI0010261BE3|nr:N-acetylmuramoyl-L-alanine amidase [Nitratidesulfovibrio sp. SRB-5]MBZ2171172.1 N-acetylmuramoyl-L-alanine amidase [Nitratidesulfovibrio sp. SRB-5]RXF76702.1 N-acetylmuramoyl-L-alanine amidase [Desulfovibrio sp. DS-1]